MEFSWDSNGLISEACTRPTNAKEIKEYFRFQISSPSAKSSPASSPPLRIGPLSPDTLQDAFGDELKIEIHNAFDIMLSHLNVVTLTLI